MKILLLGSNGQIGTDLLRTLQSLGQVVPFDRSQLDLTNVPLLQETIRNIKPQVIVNAAAYTAVDKAETEKALCFAINAAAPKVIAEEAYRNNSLLVHYSTDYVFNGQNTKPYLETDPVGPINVYGRSKLEGEQAITRSNCDHLILRTSWVYAARGKNFLLTMLQLGKEKSDLRIVGDQIGMPNWSYALADATASAIKNFSPEKKGIYHLSGKGQISWFDFASEIFTEYKSKNPDFRIPHLHRITTAEYPTPAKRPHYSVLDPHKLQKALSITLPDWKAQLQKCMKEIC